jgi:hypothetical protein
MACKYVKEFDFGTYKAGGHVKPNCKQDGGSALVGPAKVAPAMAKKGGTMCKAKGGIIEKATGERYPSREAMVKHEKKETPRMQKEEIIERTKTEGVMPRSLQARPMPAPARRPISVAPQGPLLALREGGKIPKSVQPKIGKVMTEFNEGKLKSSSGQEVGNRKQALAIALSEARSAAKKK